jgi:DnaK suppressor protein
MVQKLKQSKKAPVASKPAAAKAVPGKPAAAAPGKATGGKLGAGKPAAGKPEAAAKPGKPVAGKALPGKPVPGKPSPSGKPLAGKLAGKSGAGKPATEGRLPPAKLPTVAERARQATAAARAAAAKSGHKEAPDKKLRKPIKSPYTRKSLAPLRVKLHDLRARLTGDIDLMGKEALRADEPEVDAENVADYGSDAFERTITLELMENEARTLRLINDAFEAMDAGRFGVCGVCGEVIPLARLEALPFASNCVKCQAAAERLQ